MVSTSRRPSALLAALAGIFGLGLGYLYVGRLRLAFVPFVTVVGTIAIAGWTRLIIEPAGVYIAYSLALLFWLVSIIHPAIVAYRLDALAARPFNRGWIYVLWIVSTGLFGSYVGENRGSLFGFEPFRIPASSMAPTIQKNDLVMADTWYFDRSAPGINDLVVYSMLDNPDTKYLKRVVGLPGDIIEIREDILIRNGEPVAEEYIQLSGPPIGRLSNFGPVTVPDNQYFVLGDNRHNSRDSRFTGAIPRESLHGRVEYRWFAYDDGISWSRFPARLAPAAAWYSTTKVVK